MPLGMGERVRLALWRPVLSGVGRVDLAGSSCLADTIYGATFSQGKKTHEPTFLI